MSGRRATRRLRGDRRNGPAPSNSRPGRIYETPWVGEAIEINVDGEWQWADVKLVEPRYRRATRTDGSRGPAFRIDDRVTLKIRKTGEIVSTTPWLLDRSAIYRGVQGSLF